MKKRSGIAIAMTSACLVLLSGLTYGAEPMAEKRTPPEVNSGLAPTWGVTVVATFRSQSNSYPVYREAVTREVTHMKEKGIILIAAYRVMFGKMEKYFDVWWAPDYETMRKAFYGSQEYTAEEKAKDMKNFKDNFNAVLEPEFEIVSVERF